MYELLLPSITPPQVPADPSFGRGNSQAPVLVRDMGTDSFVALWAQRGVNSAKLNFRVSSKSQGLRKWTFRVKGKASCGGSRHPDPLLLCRCWTLTGLQATPMEPSWERSPVGGRIQQRDRKAALVVLAGEPLPNQPRGRLQGAPRRKDSQQWEVAQRPCCPLCHPHEWAAEPWKSQSLSHSRLDPMLH